MRDWKIAGGVAAGFVLGCAASAAAHLAPLALPDRAAGSNEVLKATLESAEGIEVIISDVIIPPGAQVPRHYHPGEEFIYIVEGDAVQIEEGQDHRILKAGDAYVIRKERIHSPRGGDDGARAIVFRVHVEGSPERVLVAE